MEVWGNQTRSQGAVWSTKDLVYTGPGPHRSLCCVIVRVVSLCCVVSCCVVSLLCVLSCCVVSLCCVVLCHCVVLFHCVVLYHVGLSHCVVFLCCVVSLCCDVSFCHTGPLLFRFILTVTSFRLRSRADPH